MKKLLACLTCLLLPSLAVADDTNLTSRLVMQTDDGTVPTCSSASGDGDICVGDDIETVGDATIGGAFTSTGAVTLSSTLDVTGAVTLSQGKLSGQTIGFPDKTADYTITVADCGTIISSNDDNRTVGLPAVAAGNLGCEVTIINTAAADAALLTIDPDASDGIVGGCCSVKDDGTTVCVAFTGSDNGDVTNTKAEQNKGDHITLVSDGSTSWYVTACFGSWAGA